jgi:hypothetical protein
MLPSLVLFRCIDLPCDMVSNFFFLWQKIYLLLSTDVTPQAKVGFKWDLYQSRRLDTSERTVYCMLPSLVLFQCIDLPCDMVSNSFFFLVEIYHLCLTGPESIQHEMKWEKPRHKKCIGKPFGFIFLTCWAPGGIGWCGTWPFLV